ncbi:MAG: ABC transporter substrate-binding protein [Candidatus Limnocylindrales bacterium]
MMHADPSKPRAGASRLLVLLAAGALAVGACGSSAATDVPSAGANTPPAESAAAPTPQPTPAGPAVLKVAATANITTWDPVKSFSTEALYLANIYEPLLRINPPTAAEKFTPVLAESWSTSEDGLIWTFKLRAGVTFHDGEPLTADAVKQSIEAGASTGGASFIWAALDTVTAVDPMTVEMKLKYAAPMDLVASSLYGAWIVSPKALAAAAANETYFEQGVDAGTGPYTIESYTPDKEVLLTKYDGYWGGWDGPHYDKVLVSITPEAAVQQQMLDGGEVDLALSLPLENVAGYKDDADYTFIDEPSFFNYVGFFNTARKPLDDVRVRQALSYAIPYEDIITVGAQGYGTQSRGPVPAGVFPWSQDTPQYTQDLDKAKGLLKEAGYENGGFKLNLTYAAENQNESRFAPLIKEAYAKLGVDVTITPIAFNQQWEQAKGDEAGRQDMFLLLYWPTYSDAGADNLWSLFRSSEKPFFNLSYWKNDAFDKLVDDAIGLTATHRDQAQAKYGEAMKILVDQAAGLFFYDTRFVTVVPKRVAGFEYNLNYPFAEFFYPMHPAG